ncbi:hypothetical protein TNCT_657261 [Trichonephila clavata]|uniref:Uncharacterized protein n=1 Tax=Trichonephila clavata TaxID=2740835 RepID=A0A8X6L0P5_TRICU|nr:hypothetical protein TNCT_657261 [Trichonephila clavata]
MQKSFIQIMLEEMAAVEKITTIAEKLFLSLLSKLKYFEGPLDSFDDGASPSANLMLKLHEAVWVHRKISQVLWIPFLRRHADTITSSLKNYITYTNFILCNTVFYMRNPYDKLIATCSIITAIAELSVEKGKQEFSDCSSRVFEVFFEKFLKRPFEKRGGWQFLEEYILKQRYLKWYSNKEIWPNYYKTEENLQQELKFAECVHLKARNDVKGYFFPVDSNQNGVESNSEISKLTVEVMERISPVS